MKEGELSQFMAKKGAYERILNMVNYVDTLEEMLVGNPDLKKKLLEISEDLNIKKSKSERREESKMHIQDKIDRFCMKLLEASKFTDYAPS